MNIDRIFKSASFMPASVITAPSVLCEAQAKTMALRNHDPFEKRLNLFAPPLSAATCKPEPGRSAAFKIIGNKFQEAELFGLAFFLKKKVQFKNTNLF